MKNKWEPCDYEGWADFQHRRIYDAEVAKFVWEHLRFRDKLSLRKIVTAALQGFAIIQEPDYKPSEYDGWKFDFK